MAFKQYNFEQALERLDFTLGDTNSIKEVPLQDLIKQQDLQVAKSSGSVVYLTYKIGNLKDVTSEMKLRTSLVNEINEIFYGDPNCVFIQHEKNSVYAVMDTPKKANVDTLIETVARLNVLQQVFEVKFSGVEGFSLKFGIGAVYGPLFLIPLHTNLGNSYTCSGAAITISCILAEKSLELKEPFLTNDSIVLNLKEDYRTFFSEYKKSEDKGIVIYNASIVNTYMNNWVNNHKNSTDGNK